MCVAACEVSQICGQVCGEYRGIRKESLECKVWTQGLGVEA